MPNLQKAKNSNEAAAEEVDNRFNFQERADMTTALITDSAAQLTKVLSTMNQDLLDSRQKIAGFLMAGQAGMLLQTWDIGEEVHKLTKNPDQFGENSVEQISHSLALDGFAWLKPTRLYDARDVYECWPDRTIIEDMATQGILSSQHLTEIKKLESPKDRQKMLTLAIKKKLSAKQLQNEIRGTGNKTKQSSKTRTGQPLKKPTSTAAGLKQMAAFMLKGKNLDAIIWKGYVIKRLQNMSDTSIKHELQLQVEEVLGRLEEFSTATRETLDQLRKINQHQKKVLSGKGTEAPLPDKKGSKAA